MGVLWGRPLGVHVVWGSAFPDARGMRPASPGASGTGRPGRGGEGETCGVKSVGERGGKGEACGFKRAG